MKKVGVVLVGVMLCGVLCHPVKAAGFAATIDRNITLAVALTVVGIVSNNVTEAKADGTFRLKYYSTAPTDVNKLTLVVTKPASGKDYIRVKVTKFSAKISGAYMNAVGTLPCPTVSKNIASEGTTKLTFSGETIPKPRTNISVRVTLKDYARSQSVVSEGELIQ